MYATTIDPLGAVTDIRDGALGLGRGVRAWILLLREQQLESFISHIRETYNIKS